MLVGAPVRHLGSLSTAAAASTTHRHLASPPCILKCSRVPVRSRIATHTMMRPALLHVQAQITPSHSAPISIGKIVIVICFWRIIESIG